MNTAFAPQVDLAQVEDLFSLNGHGRQQMQHVELVVDGKVVHSVDVPRDDDATLQYAFNGDEIVGVVTHNGLKTKFRTDRGERR